MKKLILTALVLLFATSAYCQSRPVEFILNDVYDSTNGALKSTISGKADMTRVSADDLDVQGLVSIDSSLYVSGDSIFWSNSGFSPQARKTGTDTGMRVGFYPNSSSVYFGTGSSGGEDAAISRTGSGELTVGNSLKTIYDLRVGRTASFDTIVRFGSSDTAAPSGGIVGRIAIISKDGQPWTYLPIYTN